MLVKQWKVQLYCIHFLTMIFFHEDLGENFQERKSLLLTSAFSEAIRIRRASKVFKFPDSKNILRNVYKRGFDANIYSHRIFLMDLLPQTFKDFVPMRFVVSIKDF